MKLQQLLIPIIIGITTQTHQAYANQTLVAPNPSILQTCQIPEKPKKEAYLNTEIMKAILERDDKVLERNEIKYKK